MAHKLPRKMSIMIAFGVFVCAFVAGQYALGQGVGGYVGSSDPRDYQNNRGGQVNNVRQTQQDKAQQDIQNSGRLVDETLVNFLQMVNNQSRPTAQQVADAKAIVTKGKKYKKSLSDAINLEVLILQAWNEYFGGDINNAQLYSRNAYKSKGGRTNRDAHASHIAMSLVSGRPAYVFPPERRRSTTSRTSTRNDGYGDGRNTGYQPYAGTQVGGNLKASAGNILDFDIEALDMDLVGQTVRPMKLTCVNSTSFDYIPSRSNLCILFWQASSKSTSSSGEPNNLSARGSRGGSSRPAARGGYDQGGYGGDRRGGYDQGGYGADGRQDYGRSYQDSSYPGGADYGMGGQKKADPFTLQMDAYGKMFGSQMINPQVKFLAINTDLAANRQAAVVKLLENPMPWATVMAVNPGSGAAQYADMNNKTPKMVVVDRTGKIRYAGPAAGFLGPMVVNHLAGPGGGSLPTMPVAAAGNASAGGMSALKNLFGGGARTTTTVTPAASNQNTTAVKPPADNGEITPESYQAGKLLEYAKMFVSAGRKPILTSKIGVDKCREIIKKYPNTKEAQEARLLLRRVPERERKRYKITDEEMGY